MNSAWYGVLLLILIGLLPLGLGRFLQCLLTRMGVSKFVSPKVARSLKSTRLRIVIIIALFALVYNADVVADFSFFIIAIILALLISLIIRLFKTWNIDKRQWLTWPSVDEYLAEQPEAYKNGISCSKCGSKNIWQGAWRGNAEWGIHHCKTCDTTLCRTES